MQPHASIKYYCAGEYGTQKQRPHYHIILFGSDLASIYKCWDHGSVDISLEPVTASAIAYTAGYVLKGHRYTMSKSDDRLPEYAQMSKGLGSNYIYRDTIDYHQNGLIPFLTLSGGVKVAMPRYYKERIFHNASFRDTLQAAAADSGYANYTRHYDEYVRAHGSDDGYFHQLVNDRRAAIKQFLLHTKKSRKL